MRRSTFLMGLVGIALTMGSCAAMRGMAAKHAYIEEQTENHEYAKPLSEVWPQARQLLFEQGFEVKDTDASNAETEWKVEDKERQRYLLSGIEVGDDKCKVQFTRATEYKTDGKWGSTDTERDIKMEYALIKKVEPDEHAKIEAEANARSKKAKEK